MKRLNTSRILPFGMVMLLFMLVWAMFHVWTRHMVTELGYSLSQEEAAKEQLLSENKALKIEISTLKSTKRLQLIAENQLGLKSPKPEQVVYLWLDE
ncbi:MAG TPA: cell division protein FtsL [Desulfomonilia bacterium]|nr:cell division protein FtsL [Desulfomonilia bacterium]